MKVNELKKRFVNIYRRNGLLVFIIAVLLAQGTAVVQHLFAKRSLRNEARRRAQTELKVKNLEICNMLNSIETAVDNQVWIVQSMLYNLDSLNNWGDLTITNIDDIVGCGLAFEENFFPKKGRWFEPYTRRGATHNEHVQIGGPDHNYLEAEWFIEGMKADGGKWSEPYYDDAGAKSMVATYSRPLRDSTGRAVALFFVDVSLDWLKQLFDVDNPMEMSVLVSRMGYILAGPERVVSKYSLYDVARMYNDTLVEAAADSMLAGREGETRVQMEDGSWASVHYAPVEDSTGWSMALVFPDNVIFSGLKQVGLILNIFFLLGFGLMIFVMWRTARNYKELQAVNVEKERIGSELRIASGIQKGMVPKTFPPYPDRDEIACFGALVPAKEVGGDLYDFYIHDEKFFFCIGDVSGKGVPASLVMAVTRSLFRTLSAHNNSPEVIMTLMNNAMSEMNENTMFVTLFIGILNLRDGTLYYSNGGHCQPVILGNGKTTPLEIEPNIPLGVMRGWQYSLQKIKLEPGNTVFMYTDGLTEAENIDHTLFGDDRLIQTLSGAESTPKPLVQRMMDAVHKFVGNADQSDDITMLAVNFIKKMEDLPKSRSIVLHNDVRDVPQLAAFIESISESIGLDMSATMNINLAMEEAVVNVMKYAYPEGTHGDILVEANSSGNELTFAISDSGIPFDPTKNATPDTTLDAEERPIGGLGIHLVRNLMDSVEYNYIDNKNVLTLKKKI